MVFIGTEYTINACGHATDIVGYDWNTEKWCPRCTLDAMGVATTGPLHYGRSLESEIETYVQENGLEIWREDSTRVPQPVFNGEDAFDNDGRAERCCRCHERLVEQDEPEED